MWVNRVAGYCICRHCPNTELDTRPDTDFGFVGQKRLFDWPLGFVSIAVLRV